MPYYNSSEKGRHMRKLLFPKAQNSKYVRITKKVLSGLIVSCLPAVFVLIGCAGPHGPIYVPSILSQATDTYIYYGGPFFIPDGTQTVSEIARFSATGQIAAITALNGSSRILLIGFHPEVTSDAGLTSSDTNRTWLNEQMVWVLTGTTPTAPIAIYAESREVWSPSVSGFQALCTAARLTCTTITASDLNASTTSLSFYRAIIMPGGYYVGVSVVGRSGQTAINNLISSGGSYIGVCSGAYLAASSISWEGGIRHSGLGYFHGSAIGAIDAISAWPGEVLTPILH
jgi:glutamine amidotransferase-like uncharacterized protein